MKYLGGNKSKKTKVKNGKNIIHLEITELVFFHYNIISNHYQQDSRVLCQLLDTSAKKFIS